MPYVRCATCGLTTFVVRAHTSVPSCPGCDQILDGASAAEAYPDRGVDATLSAARQSLQMDVAMLTEVDAEREIARHVSGEWPGLGSLVGASLPLEETFCKRMLEGAISNVVGDVARDERVRDLQFARALGVGAWLGVPLPASVARLYVLCCLAREAHDLGERDVELLRGFAATLSSQLSE